MYSQPLLYRNRSGVRRTLTPGLRARTVARAVGLSAGLLLAGSLAAMPACAAELDLAPIYLGGVTSQMSNLADPAATSTYRSHGGAFYAHESYILANTSGPCPTQTASPSLAATISNFAASPPPMAEIGLMTPLAIEQLMTCNYQAVGLTPQVALVNVVYGVSTLADFKAMVNAGRSVGLMKIGPFATANTFAEPTNWNDPYWATMKAMALYGGVVAMDTPPTLYKIRGASYITFAQQVLAWAKAHGVECIDVVSPENGETSFTSDVLAWGTAISTPPGSLPDAFVVENYNYGTTPDIGTDSTPSTLTYAALAGLYALGH